MPVVRYVSERIDRRTGELLEIDIGDWLTITELGAALGEGPRSIRAILLEMAFLQPETYGSSRHTRMRLCPWVVTRGWGKRIEKRNRPPFDTVSPEAQDWVRERLASTKAAIDQRASADAQRATYELHRFIAWRVAERVNREEEFTTGRKFLWLADHYPDLTQEDIAVVLEVSPSLVSKMVKERKSHRGAVQKRKTTVLPDIHPKPTHSTILLNALTVGNVEVVLPPCG